MNHYDQAIARYMKHTFLEDDTNAHLQLTEKNFIRPQYVFTINCRNKKFDHVISTALCDIKAYDPYFNKFNLFSLTSNFLTTKERNLHCSHQIMLRTKQTYTYFYYKFIQHHYTHLIHHHETRNIDSNLLTLNILHPSSLISHTV